ncbi:MAG: hypothetical protein FJZ47_10730, partial [Candidatus Tectomicrobia bacterium]|nr:hypothetical protein [Candidatus Tectomicrobia bacterium]
LAREVDACTHRVRVYRIWGSRAPKQELCRTLLGHGLSGTLQRVAQRGVGATVFGYWVKDPERYGVVALDRHGQAIGLEEKPARPQSHYAVTGLYFYDNQVLEIAANIRPSARGELEITDVNKTYLAQGTLHVELWGRGMAWLDMGTQESLLQAANFIEAVESRQGLKIACPEEVAYRMSYIDAAQLARLAHPLCQTRYGQYLLDILQQEG